MAARSGWSTSLQSEVISQQRENHEIPAPRAAQHGRRSGKGRLHKPAPDRARAEEAISAYDKIIGLELGDLAIDGSQHKAPFGGEATGPSPVDRGKRGWKWSIATDARGIPVAWVPAAANANDCTLFAPTLDALALRGLLEEVEVVHLDRGYDYDQVREACTSRQLDSVIPKRRPRGSTKRPKRGVILGQRWPVERTNSWLSNFGQLRRNTDRFSVHRAAALALAVVLIITVKLVKWANRWNG